MTNTLLYEGKAKIIYATEEPGVLLAVFKDNATAFNAQKRGTIGNKGQVNATVSAQLFRFLAEQGVRNHFIDQPAPNQLRFRQLRMIPLEVVVRNVVAGSLCTRTGLPRGQVLLAPLVEFFYKNDSLGDPLFNDEHIALLELATPAQLAQIRTSALAVNEWLRAFYAQRGIRLIDFKLEYGWDEAGQLSLGDELSPDNCRLWDIDGDRVLDKDRFRLDMGGVDQSYYEVMQRVLQL
ncbi:phosphoribosylaminoimidazolesuccinocarboxamide synthase [Anthocerotibacter panamensis]|uniref:phosphoribosylaminoimidazolesuccinocarboxamide synthase n=1 Tax=Anthocerotibacter panamensis TaxID=2857077 RepID=UPI001C408082|nr:phosphoribosylaminoimidazolesuccinocarboxamide synthase [Anthocerotibacter panamensis]